MFDFRYHALTLVAVFLALLVGLLLGVAIGDAGLVSSAQQDVRASLRSDVRAAQQHASDLEAQLTQHELFEQQAYPLLVGGRLAGERIGLIALGNVSDDTVRAVRDAVAPAGPGLQSVVVVREPLDLAGLAQVSQDPTFATLASDPAVVMRFARRMAIAFVNGAGAQPRSLISRVRDSLFEVSEGDLAGVGAVVLVRSPPAPGTTVDPLQSAFEQGLVAGLHASGVPVVGVETTTTQPSQIGWYRANNLASVDDVDQLAGQAALVFALGCAQGAYGVKPSADALLPKAVNSCGVTTPASHS